MRRKILYTTLILTSLIFACVSQEQRNKSLFYQSMQTVDHFNLSNREEFLPQCSEKDCFDKYAEIQSLIDNGDYQDAVNKTIERFNLDISGLRKIDIVESFLEERAIASTNTFLEIELTYKAFSSAEAFVIYLAHELGHIKVFNDYIDILKTSVGIPQKISNVALINALLNLDEGNFDEITIQRTYWLGIFPREKMIVQGYEITPEQAQEVINLHKIFSQAIKGEGLEHFFEMDVILYTLKLRRKLYFPDDAKIVSSQVGYLKENYEKGFKQAIRNYMRVTLTGRAQLTESEHKFISHITDYMNQQLLEAKLFLVTNYGD